MYFVAWGETGFGDWIWEIDRGRPLGISTHRWLSRRESLLDDEVECLSREDEVLDEECLDELVFEEECLLEDFSWGTSRMFRTRPVVGSVVDGCPGSCDTW
jgi:hypothetical protein